MADVIYVVGLHRGGTHEFAGWMATQKGYVYVDEGKVEWNDLEAATRLRDDFFKVYNIETNSYSWVKLPKDASGYVLQCPGLSHETQALAKLGKVYWVTRRHLHVITSMKNANIGVMAWDLMKDFKRKWPNDPVWDLMKYEDGGEDVKCNFVGYYTLLVKLKEYIWMKYLYLFAEMIHTEQQPYYAPEKTVTAISPLKPRELAMFEKYEKKWATEVWSKLYDRLPDSQ